MSFIPLNEIIKKKSYLGLERFYPQRFEAHTHEFNAPEQQSTFTDFKCFVWIVYVSFFVRFLLRQDITGLNAYGVASTACKSGVT